MTTRDATIIVYPETDGLPLPDGDFQAPLYVRIVSTLRIHFADVRGARVNGDTFIYYVEGNRRRSVSPDCYVALDLSAEALASIERNNAYMLWEVGKSPDFVLEIGSESTAEADLGAKRDLYAEIGVSEYWRFDATGGDFYGEPLVGERLVDGAYRRFELRHERDGRAWSHSDALNLDLWWDDRQLRFWDPVAATWLLSHEEDRTGRLEAESRAEQEATRAEEEATRADRAEGEVRRLRARLEELGQGR